MAETSIEWTERTWNPVTGCTKRSAGCKHCYAEAMALRLHALGVPTYMQGFALTLYEAKIDGLARFGLRLGRSYRCPPSR